MHGPDGKPIEPVKRLAKKAKPKNAVNVNSLEYLSKEIQKLSKNLANPKDKERYLELKEKYYREFLVKVLKSNGIENPKFPNASFAPYKYYIGRGNNSGIVRTALKSRFGGPWVTSTIGKTTILFGRSGNRTKSLHVSSHGKNIRRYSKRKRTKAQLLIDQADNSQLSTQATEEHLLERELITTPKKTNWRHRPSWQHQLRTTVQK